MKLSNRAKRLIGQKMFSILVRANELERQGRELLHFEIGDSCFNPPEKATKALLKAISKGKKPIIQIH